MGRAATWTLAAALLVACATVPGGGGLGGTRWQLARIRAMDGTVTTPDEPGKYTLAFEVNGQVAVRADCNRGHGVWTAAGAQLTLGPLATTRAQCPPGSLHDRFLRDLGEVRSYVVTDGRLHLILRADAAVYELDPAVR